ncbi:hypothetical protein ON010_g6459 [Phytophthora cinnamomi]|nr:hypothetical protein ON010_g6459 [Phytophthora cinnamomi]
MIRYHIASVSVASTDQLLAHIETFILNCPSGTQYQPLLFRPIRSRGRPTPVVSGAVGWEFALTGITSASLCSSRTAARLTYSSNHGGGLDGRTGHGDQRAGDRAAGAGGGRHDGHGGGGAPQLPGAQRAAAVRRQERLPPRARAGAPLHAAEERLAQHHEAHRGAPEAADPHEHQDALHRAQELAAHDGRRRAAEGRRLRAGLHDGLRGAGRRGAAAARGPVHRHVRGERRQDAQGRPPEPRHRPRGRPGRQDQVRRGERHAHAHRAGRPEDPHPRLLRQHQARARRHLLAHHGRAARQGVQQDAQCSYTRTCPAPPAHAPPAGQSGSASPLQQQFQPPSATHPSLPHQPPAPPRTELQRGILEVDDGARELVRVDLRGLRLRAAPIPQSHTVPVSG